MRYLRASAVGFFVAAAGACGGSTQGAAASSTVVVHVLDAQGTPIAGLRMRVAGKNVTTDATGTASASPAGDTYDVALVDPRSPTVVAYDGLRDREVTINAPWASAPQSSPQRPRITDWMASQPPRAHLQLTTSAERSLTLR